MSEYWQSLKSSLVFVLICLGIAVALVLIARLLERLSPKEERTSISTTRYITVVALSAALASVLMLLDIPLFFAPSFYKLDLSELPALIAGFALGPTAGVLTEFLKVLLKLLFKPTSTAFVGEFSNFVLGTSMILPAAAIYRFKKTKTRAIIGLVVGTLVMTVFGSLLNAFYLIPQYARLFGISVDAIVAMGAKVNPKIDSLGKLVMFAVVPFNLLKGLLVSAIVFFLYKYIKPLLVGRSNTNANLN